MPGHSLERIIERKFFMNLYILGIFGMYYKSSAHCNWRNNENHG